ncbi:starch synthase [Candidatus Saganbacteria bacterium CG08_land_8_20_14_0_20_45_16]|uniref:Glycogen synthase n=1 Tax=Candidatus Saganbacteria bacterium CG08_land_8_20_14_0_20_45_16 TaxID=2014293 RepID=A0A2H0Y1D7_UNCSA|nr:MAG: starch synthase [Candidatus Saganbacteria bacterium CG08_land_8_20_14_0_20_45_16]
MKILLVSAEVAPFAKAGGLADFAAGLSKAIRTIGHDIRLVMPLYKIVADQDLAMVKEVSLIRVEVADQQETLSIYSTKLPGSEVIVYFVGNKHFAVRDELYAKDGRDYPDNFTAFFLFCQAALSFLLKIAWLPDIVHCNDWPSGLMPLLLGEYRKKALFQRTASVYSIHNIVYQGIFPATKFSAVGLPAEQASFAKIGLETADVISTVTPAYAKKIQTKEFGAGLDKILQKRSTDLFGLVSGIDISVWQPATDPLIFRRYSRPTLSLKAKNKLAWQQQEGWQPDESVPLLFFMAGPGEDEALALLGEVLTQLLKLTCQIIILGGQNLKGQVLLRQIKEKYPAQIAFKPNFNDQLLHQAYAAADVLLLLSQDEPGSLIQLIGYKYGVIPIIYEEGGAIDTVVDFDQTKGTGTGFILKKYQASVLLATVNRAITAYQDRLLWQKLQARVMELDFSWTKSAGEYLSLYLKAFDKRLATK